MKPLVGTVALVTGATRGIGRGIAWRFGVAGATVYCSGRGRRPASTAGYQAGGPDPIEETAAMVDRGGGVGIPVRLDHSVNSQVARLFARVQDEQGRLDVLVDVDGAGTSVTPSGRFWTHTRSEAHRLCRAVWPHVVACEHAVPLMVARGSGLIVEVTSRRSLFERPALFSDLGRVAQTRLASAVAKEIAPHGVTALAVTPGCLPTDVLDADVEGLETRWAYRAQSDPLLVASETPGFIGRVMVALAIDPRISRRSGGLYSTWALAKEYGITSEDGRGPGWEHHISEPFGPVLLDDGLPPASRPRVVGTTRATATEAAHEPMVRATDPECR